MQVVSRMDACEWSAECVNAAAGGEEREATKRGRKEAKRSISISIRTRISTCQSVPVSVHLSHLLATIATRCTPINCRPLAPKPTTPTTTPLLPQPLPHPHPHPHSRRRRRRSPWIAQHLELARTILRGVYSHSIARFVFPPFLSPAAP